MSYVFCDDFLLTAERVAILKRLRTTVLDSHHQVSVISCHAISNQTRISFLEFLSTAFWIWRSIRINIKIYFWISASVGSSHDTWTRGHEAGPRLPSGENFLVQLQFAHPPTHAHDIWTIVCVCCHDVAARSNLYIWFLVRGKWWLDTPVIRYVDEILSVHILMPSTF